MIMMSSSSSLVGIGCDLSANSLFFVYFLIFAGQQRNSFCIVVNNVNYLTLNPTGPIHKQFAVNCLMEIAENQFVPHFRLLSVSNIYNLTSPAAEIQNAVICELNKSLKWTLKIVGNLSMETGEEERFNEFETNVLPNVDYYVVVADSYETFYKTFKQLRYMKNFHMDAVVVVYLAVFGRKRERTLKLALARLKKYQITKGLALLPEADLSKIGVYGENRVYEQDNICGTEMYLEKLAVCDRGVMPTKKNFFPEVDKLDLKNCTMKVITAQYPPYIINPENNTGFEIKLLNEIGVMLNMSFAYTQEKKSNNWGYKRENGSWTGRLNIVMENNTIGIGNIVPESGMEQDFLLTDPYFFEHMIWVVPMAQRAPRWKCIIVLFNETLWMAVFVSFFVASLVFFIFAVLEQEQQSFRSLGSSFFMTLRLMTSCAVPLQPYKLVMRTFFFTIAIYGLLLSCLYQSMLAAVLPRPIYEHQMHTVQEMVDSRIGIGGIKEFRDIFENSDDPNWKYIYEIYEIYNLVNDTYYDWLITVSLDRDTCTISGNFYVDYLISTNDPQIVDRKGVPMIYVLKEVVLIYPIRMVLPKSFPYLEKFNKAIGIIMASGLIDNWTSDVKQKIKESKERQRTIMAGGDEDVKLSLNHMQGAFALLIVGFICGGIVFLVEFTVWRISISKAYKMVRKYLTSKCFNKKRKNKKKKPVTNVQAAKSKVNYKKKRN